MARPSRGLWWNDRAGAWFVTVRDTATGKRRQVNLGADRTQAEIELGKLRAAAPVPKGDAGPLEPIAALFLDYVTAEHPKSYVAYRSVFRSLFNFRPGLRVCEVNEKLLAAWFKSHTAWGDGGRRTAITVMIACLRWARADRQGYITGDYLRGVVRPRVRSRGRQAVFPLADHEKLCAVAPRWLADALESLWQTGARPSEICKVTAADVSFAQQLITLEDHKTVDATGEPRSIDMTPALEAILRRLAAVTPDGPIFRAARGEPLTPEAINHGVRYHRGKAGVKIIPYGYRHSLATHLLEHGTDPQVVAHILGHKTTATLWRHYAHLLADRPAHRAAIAAVR